jgi:DNA polymerase III subunit delta
MVAVKAHQAANFLKAPDPRLAAVLFYGPDAGLVGERGQALARAMAAKETPPGEILRFEDADLEDDSDRLGVELRTLPMFGGRKIVRATAGRRISAATLRPLLEEGALAGFLIVEAGNLRPDDTLRTLFEKSTTAAAVACFPDEAHDLEAVVRDVLGAAKMGITADAREVLLARLGADRALTRGELEKLALYAHGRRTIEVEDVEAIVGDASELALDKIPLAAAGGQADRALLEFDRTLASGESPQTILLALERHFQRLHRIRAQVEQGRALDDVLRQQRPPLHFKQRDAVAAQCRRWPLSRLSRALAAITRAITATRNGGPEQALAQRLILDLAAAARDGTAQPPRR